MALRQNSEDAENQDIPPYEGAMWDDEFNTWVSNPIDPEIYDEEGNYRIRPEDIVVEPAHEPVLAAAAAPTLIQPQESRRDRMRRLMRERAPARAPAPPPPPTPPTEDPRIIEARIGLPAPWEAHISNTYNVVYYFDPRNGSKQWERPTMGGKRTRRRPQLRLRSRAKRPKRKRSATRRKRTTTRRK